MNKISIDSFKTQRTLNQGGKSYEYYSLKALDLDLTRMPFSIKILLENLLRHENGVDVTQADIKSLCEKIKNPGKFLEISYNPARVLMQDFTGVPAVVDLASLRARMEEMGGDPVKINPLTPVDLVIDHSLSVEYFGDEDSHKKNVQLEFQRNKERYSFLKWGQSTFANFRVVPPGTGICHQVNLEYLAKVIWTGEVEGKCFAYPDTLVGTDSHTTMIGGLAVLGWGVGGIEAEAVMLGKSISMLVPDVVGFRLSGKLAVGSTATDLVLKIVQMLREKGVVGKFVEFYGDGLDTLPLSDRATISNMAPEYGATCGFFPIDQETLRFLNISGRPIDEINLVEAYAKEQGMWREKGAPDPLFTSTLELDLSEIVPAVAGPKRPQDRINLNQVSGHFHTLLTEGSEKRDDFDQGQEVKGKGYSLTHGSVVIAAITSCTNTSNPYVMVAAGLLARNANKLGLKVKPWVKTSLAPGSQIVTDYLEKSGLGPELDALGFNLVGYGCTTCIGNSGPLDENIVSAIKKGKLVSVAVLSGNRNFEGRIGPDVAANYLASPPLVVAYALAGNLQVDLTTAPLGHNVDGNAVYLKDIWPSEEEVQKIVDQTITREMFIENYKNVFAGTSDWQDIAVEKSLTYIARAESTYIKLAPFFSSVNPMIDDFQDIKEARVLALLGDSITTDHISPAGTIDPDSPAGKFLKNRDVSVRDFNSFGARRGNHEIMLRGTFGNLRLKNVLAEGKIGGFTKHIPSGEILSIYEAAMKYMLEKTPLVVIAGKEYGTGSSRDWAAKGTLLLGVKAVIAASFERIHRSNLVGMGVFPLQFKEGEGAASLKIVGDEKISISIPAKMTPGMTIECKIERSDGVVNVIELVSRIDTVNEVEYYQSGGILHSVLRKMLPS